MSLAACAGGDTSLSVRCEAACDRAEMCQSDASEFCRADCAERAAALLPAFRDAYLVCYADLQCDLDEATCEGNASGGIDRRPTDETFTDSCEAKLAECDDAFKSAFCFQSHYFEEDRVTLASGCFAMTCDTVESCLQREMPFAPFGR